MKPVYSTALFLLFSAFSLTAQQSETSNIENEQRFIFSANVNYAIRLGKAAEDSNDVQKDYVNKLRTGISFDLSGYYRLNKSSAIGLKYDVYRSKASVSGIDFTVNDGTVNYDEIISDDITISFIGPSYMFMAQFPASRSNISVEGSIGYLTYKNKQHVLNDYTLKGASAGFIVGFNYKFEAFRNFYIGPQAILLAGIVNKYKVTGAGGYNETIRLKGDDVEDLSRIDLGVTASYRF